MRYSLKEFKIRGIRATHANSPRQYQYVFCLGDVSMFPSYYVRCKQVKLFWDLLHVLILTAMKGCLARFSQPTRSLSFRAAISPPAGKTVTGHRSLSPRHRHEESIYGASSCSLATCHNFSEIHCYKVAYMISTLWFDNRINIRELIQSRNFNIHLKAIWWGTHLFFFS